MKKTFLTIYILLLTGCATLSEQECKHANWTAVGHSDGKDGDTRQRIDAHSRACADYGITPDSVEYNFGFIGGNKLFCSQSGFNNGVQGYKDETDIPDVCKDVTAYQTGHQKGFRKHCHAQGVEAGTKADKKLVPKSCLGLERFNNGFAEGLKKYCTFKNGFSKGYTASEHNAESCPSSIRHIFYLGHERGIKEYCQRKNGFRLGKEKSDYKPFQCPGPLKQKFEKAYNLGKRYTTIGLEIEKLEEDFSNLDHRIRYTQVTKEEREQLVREARKNKHKGELLKVEIVQIKETMNN